MENTNEEAMHRPAWKLRAAEKRAKQAECIPRSWRLFNVPINYTSALEVIRTCGIFTPAELALREITNGRILQQKLLAAEVMAVEVITALSERAAVAQQLSGRWWVSLIGKSVEENSLGVDLILALGANIYVKTDIPQSPMMSDSYNHIFKQSVNFLNRNLISGGSSGGESTLVGARGSILGIGIDIGGSMRIPAVLQSLYGLCPTISRVPNDSSARTQKHVVPPVAGPMASDLSSIELYMDALLASEPWNRDPHLLPIPWRQELTIPPLRLLRLAFIHDGGVIKPQPPIERAVRETATKLAKAGHRVIDWDTKGHAEAYAMWLEAVLADGREDCRQLCLLVNEPLVEGILMGKTENTLSVTLRRDLERKLRYQRDFLKRWIESDIDAIIMPVLPWIAFPSKTWVKSKQWVGYTAHWNLLNYASLTIPATTMNPS